MPGKFSGAVPNMETSWTLAKGRELTEFLTRISASSNSLQSTPTGDGISLIQAGVPGATGDDTAPAPADHVHAVVTAVPSIKVQLSGTMIEGVGPALMRAGARLVLAQGGAGPGQGLVWDPALGGWVPQSRSILPWIL